MANQTQLTVKNLRNEKKALLTAEEAIQKNVQDSIKNDKVPKIYTNGFINGYTSSDAYIMFQCNGESVAFMNMSFTCLKSLHEGLGKFLSDFELKNNHTLLLMNDIAENSNNQ